MPNRSVGPTTMLGRHLAVLNAFTVGDAFLNLTQISHRTGLALSTVHRLMKELEEERLVEKLPDRTYQLGLRLWEFAAKTPRAAGLREIAAPVMRMVQDRIKEHTQLGVAEGDDVVYLERMSHPQAVVNLALVGERLPLALSVIGHVLLADTSDEDITALAEHGFPALAQNSPRSPEDLLALIKVVRARGFAVGHGLVHADASAVAVPIHDSIGDVVAGLAVVFPAHSARAEEYLQVLLHAGQAISKQLRTAYLEPSHPHALPAARYRALINSSHSSMGYLAEPW